MNALSGVLTRNIAHPATGNVEAGTAGCLRMLRMQVAFSEFREETPLELCYVASPSTKFARRAVPPIPASAHKEL